MNRRRRMMFESRWASAPLIVYDGSANVQDTIATWQINLNNGYKDAGLTNKQWATSIYNELKFRDDGAEVYLEDVTRYKKLCMTYTNIVSGGNEHNPSYKDFGVAKDKNYGTSAKYLSIYDGDYDVYAKIPDYVTTGTVQLNIENLEGRKMIGFYPQFSYSGDEDTGIIVHKIWLE